MLIIYAIFMTVYAIGMLSCVIYLIKRRNATNYILNQLGICTRCFGSMPCLECGRGL